MSPTTPPPDPPPGTSWTMGEAASLAGVPGGTGGMAGGVVAKTGAATTGGPVGHAGRTRAGEGAHEAALPFPVEVLDRLSQRLTMAGLRLASLRRRLAGVEDRMMLIQASDDLDEAIAEVRRLALKVSGMGLS